MSQAILTDRRSIFGHYSLENGLPWLRTLIDMLLLIGGAIVVMPVFSFYLVPNGWKMAVYQAGGLASVFAGATLVISTARTNRLQQRQTAQLCIATVMLFMGGLLIFASQAIPGTECVWYINVMTTCVAIWGLLCLGLILIERRIITKLNSEETFHLKAGVRQTLWRIFAIFMTFTFSISFLMLPYAIFELSGQSWLDEIFEHSGRYPTRVEHVALSVIWIWIILAKSLYGWYFLWPHLNLFHSPTAESSKSLPAIHKSISQRLYLSFILTGFMGYLAYLGSFGTTDFGLESTPWILTAMYLAVAIASWNILQRDGRKQSA